MLEILETEFLRNSLSPIRNLPALQLYSGKPWNSFQFPLYALKRRLLVESTFLVWRSHSWRQMTDAMHAVTRLNGLALLHRTFGFHFPPANTIRVSQQQSRQNCATEIKQGESLFNTTPNEIWWHLVSLQAFLLDHQQLWNLLKYLYGTAFHFILSFAGNHLCIIYWIHLCAAYSCPTI